MRMMSYNLHIKVTVMFARLRKILYLQLMGRQRLKDHLKLIVQLVRVLQVPVKESSILTRSGSVELNVEV